MNAVIEHQFSGIAGVAIAALIAVVATVVTAAPAYADAAASGCLPLNGTQLTASSHETSTIGITYDSTVTYWYQDGAVNWHKTLDGGELNLTHTNTFGTVPAGPGSTETIPGTGGRVNGSPMLVTVCSK